MEKRETSEDGAEQGFDRGDRIVLCTGGWAFNKLFLAVGTIDIIVVSFWMKSPAKLPQPSKRKENVGRIGRKEEEEEKRENGGWQVVWGDDIPLGGGRCSRVK